MQIEEKKSISIINRCGDGISVLFFQTVWSGSSLLTLIRLKSALRKIQMKDHLCLIDVDKDFKIAEELGIYEVPTILFLRNGVPIGKLENIVSEEDIIHSVDALKKMKNKDQSYTNS